MVMEASTSLLSVRHPTHPVGCHCSTAIPLLWHRGAIAASPRSLAMLCVGRAVVASAEGAEASASSSVCFPSGGYPIGERWSKFFWAGTPVPTDCSPGDGRPSAVNPSPCQLSPGLIACGLAREKTLSTFLNEYKCICIH